MTELVEFDGREVEGDGWDVLRHWGCFGFLQDDVIEVVVRFVAVCRERWALIGLNEEPETEWFCSVEMKGWSQ